jgi:hypothetical protein
MSSRGSETIAERLRRKNQELISSSSDRPSNDNRSAISDRFSSLRGDRSSGGSDSSYTSAYSRSQSSTASSFRDRGSANTDSTSRSSSTGSASDAKGDIQKKLEAAQKDLADYKSKYDKIMKEKANVQEQMDKAKTDVEKITELKNDNLRLKDENGALIRVISKLSRTPTSTSAS